MTDLIITETVTDSTVSVETVEIATASVEVIEVGQRGPAGPTGATGPQGIQGIQGPAGPAGGSIPQFTAGENLSGHRAIRLHNGLAYYCDSTTLAHAGTAIGVSTGAALAGDPVNVQTIGIVAEPSWTWSDGPVYVGPNGSLSQTISGVFVQQIGVAGNSTELNIAPQLAVLRN